MRRATLSWALVPLLLLTGAVFAHTTQIPSVDWWLLSGGGAPALSASESIALNGSLGQTAIGPSFDDGVALGGGFWYGLSRGVYEVYLPLVLRES